MAPGEGDGQRFSDPMAEVLAMVTADDGAGLSSASAVECARVLGVTGIGVAVFASRDGRSDDGEPVWGSGALVLPLDDLEFTLGEGPGVDAATGSPVLVSDLAGQSRWPMYAPAAQKLGACAVFALPLRIGAIKLGVCTAYRLTPGPLSPQQLVDALVFADAMAMLLLDPTGPAIDDQPRWLAGQLTAGRSRVHQATGMISVQLGISLAEALVRLRAYAYRDGRSIDAVAADVVTRRLRFNDQR